jgi:hypothetical protein
MLGMVGVALMLLTRELGFELQRTRAASEEAQFRQLLLAGAEDAAAHAAQWDAQAAPQKWTMDLPRSLSDQGASVSLESARSDEDGRTVLVAANLGGHERVQSLFFRRAHDAWQVSTRAANEPEQVASIQRNVIFDSGCH